MAEMEEGIDAGVPLDYAAIQILPAQNRYEAYVCSGNKVEILASGLLELLLLHLPIDVSLGFEGSGDNFKLQLPENLNGAAWFTKSTLSRFLHMAGLPDLLSKTNAIENEMFQLEEARKFHVSLYTQSHQDHGGTWETDSCNSNYTSPALKSQVEVAPSDGSRNELLRAMDLRLIALKGEFVAALNEATGATCSIKEITDLARFSQHFGAIGLRNSLYKFLELTQNRGTVDTVNVDNFSCLCNLRSDGVDKMAVNSQKSKSVNLVKPVKYGASPAKVALLERHSSTESDESSNSGDDVRISPERSRSLLRCATPRRSASPMRRIQIGRNGSRKATALTIKSLNYIPSRERSVPHGDVTANNSGEEGSDQTFEKPESNVQRMSVQDAINLFESKQRDQITAIHNKSLTDTFAGANKTVLRRWSAGMGESSTKHKQEIVSEGFVLATSNILMDGDVVESSEVKSESNMISGNENFVENAELDVKLELCANNSYDLIGSQADALVNQGEEMSERLTPSVEWNRQKEVELKEMMMQMTESKPVKIRNMVPESSRNEQSFERRIGFNDCCTKKGEKLRGEAGRHVGKEAQFRVNMQILDQKKVEMAFSKANDVGNKQVNNSHKPQKNFPKSVNLRKETAKPAVIKKVSSKASSLPTVRKSWPSTPLPRNTGTSPARNSSRVPAGPKATRQKSQPTPSLPRSVLKMEGSQKQQKNVKDIRVHTNRSSSEKKQPTLIKGGRSSKTTKPEILAAPGNYSSMIPVGHSFYSKVTKKSSVVPLESKPYLRKGSGIGPGVGPVIVKAKISSQSAESPKACENMVQVQENEMGFHGSDLVHQQQDGNLVILNTHDADLESEIPVNNGQRCGDIENSDSVVADGSSSFERIIDSPSKIQAEEESVISPVAWVEIEEQQALPAPCNGSRSQHSSPAHVSSLGLSSPRVRHSLSQMLQEESSEPDIVEWGNSENLPAIYQRDGPKGLKRLLMFARKSRGGANITGWSSPSTFSEGEDDAEESKAISRRNPDNILRKTALHANNYGHRKTSLFEAQSSAGESNVLSGSHKLQERQVSAAATSTKATRSFFSLSAFRGSKLN